MTSRHESSNTISSYTRSAKAPILDAPRLSADGWVLRPETGPQSYRQHAFCLYQALYAMSPRDRRAFADAGGGMMAPSRRNVDEFSDCLQVVRGTKPAALAFGSQKTRSLAARLILAELNLSRTPDNNTAPIDEAAALDYLQDHAREHGLVAFNDLEMEVLTVSHSCECASMLEQAIWHEPRNAWRHVLTGVALGYSDADIARFLSRDTPAMNFTIGHQPRFTRNRERRDARLSVYAEHCAQGLTANGRAAAAQL